MQASLLIVSPVRNEAEHLEATARSLVAQTRQPDLWVVVDDGSTDGTAELAARLGAEIPFMRVLEAPPIEGGHDRLAAAADAIAFNWALSETGGDWDFIGKLDGDIELDPAHFERLFDEFGRDDKLGLAGSWLEEQHGGDWVPNEHPENHVNGAVKLYRRACFDAIGGIEERLGWDTIDQTRARMLGWRTRSFRDLRARHLRRSGSAAGLLRGKARHGRCVWIVSYPPELVIARGVRMALRERPLLIGGLAFLGGYGRAAVARKGRVEDPQLRRFARGEQRARIRAALPRRASRD